jgi:hypothetical protein
MTVAMAGVSGGAVPDAAAAGASSASRPAWPPPHLRVPLIILYYGTCSSLLIVINKVAVHSLRTPVFILIMQLAFAASTVSAGTAVRVITAEKLQWRLVRPFLLIVAGFLGTLFGAYVCPCV